MFFVIFWTALVRYTWPSNSSRFFFRQSVLSDVFGLNAPAVWAQRCGAGGCRREATWIVDNSGKGFGLTLHPWALGEKPTWQVGIAAHALRPQGKGYGKRYKMLQTCNFSRGALNPARSQHQVTVPSKTKSRQHHPRSCRSHERDRTPPMPKSIPGMSCFTQIQDPNISSKTGSVFLKKG